MKIGINGSTDIALGVSIHDMVDHVAEAEAAGFASYWLAQLAVPDALTVIAMMGSRTSTIEIGTAVIPTWPRHPLMLAAQALTVQEAIGNRLALGIGLAHKVSVESTLKIPFATPAKHMDEYLSVLLPAMTDRKVSFTGDIWSAEVEGIVGVPGATPPKVLLAAMGPRMLRLAGARTDGSILWLSGPKAIAEQIKPALDAAAEAAGRPTPRIVASVPVCVTSSRRRRARHDRRAPRRLQRPAVVPGRHGRRGSGRPRRRVPGRERGPGARRARPRSPPRAPPTSPPSSSPSTPTTPPPPGRY